MTRRPLLLLAAMAVASHLGAQTNMSVTSTLDTWYARTSRLAPGKWGVVVADQSGNVLWQVNGNDPMVPASTVKLLTTGFARTAVGGDARRPTRVIGSGKVDSASGMWQGRWALEMNGDPTLERADRGGPMMVQLAQQLAAIGIRKLVGPLDVTTSAGEARSIFPSVWADRFRGRTYAPLVGPIMLNEGLVNISVGPGPKLGSKAVVVGDAPSGAGNLVTITATTVEGRKSSLRFTALKGGRFQITGRIGIYSAPRRYETVSTDPSSVLEACWQRATQLAGIEWIRSPGMSAPGFTDRRVLAEIASESFDSVAHEINTRSLNIGAEMLLRWGSAAEDAAARLTDHVRNITGISTGIHLVDGSGLSSDDRVAPVVFTTYLAKFPQTLGGKNFPLLLPANGSGTLRRLATGLPGPGVVRAKTGTLGDVITLVGYLGRNEGTLLIALMYNGGATGRARQQEWDLFRKLGADGIVIPADAEGVAGGPGQP